MLFGTESAELAVLNWLHRAVECGFCDGFMRFVSLLGEYGFCVDFAHGCFALYKKISPLRRVFGDRAGCLSFCRRARLEKFGCETATFRC